MLPMPIEAFGCLLLCRLAGSKDVLPLPCTANGPVVAFNTCVQLRLARLEVLGKIEQKYDRLKDRRRIAMRYNLYA